LAILMVAILMVAILMVAILMVVDTRMGICETFLVLGVEWFRAEDGGKERNWHGVTSMKRTHIALATVLLLFGAKSSQARLEGWNWMNWPWAFPATEIGVDPPTWNYIDENRPVYCCDMVSGVWSIMGSGPNEYLGSGWVYFQCPWVYANDRWYYLHEAEAAWCASVTDHSGNVTTVWSTIGLFYLLQMMDYIDLVRSESGDAGAVSYVSRVASVGSWVFTASGEAGKIIDLDVFDGSAWVIGEGTSSCPARDAWYVTVISQGTSCDDGGRFTWYNSSTGAILFEVLIATSPQ
jgi:hypothetical protein